MCWGRAWLPPHPEPSFPLDKQNSDWSAGKQIVPDCHTPELRPSSCTYLRCILPREFLSDCSSLKFTLLRWEIRLQGTSISFRGSQEDWIFTTPLLCRRFQNNLTLDFLQFPGLWAGAFLETMHGRLSGYFKAFINYLYSKPFYRQVSSFRLPCIYTN